MLLENEQNYGLGMDALVFVCSWNMNGIMVWAWMLWSPYALGKRTELWFGHGCSGLRMLLENDRNYGLGMDALVTVCSWNTNGIMVWAWMLWSSYALGTRTELWFGHGCSGDQLLLETVREKPGFCHGRRMDGLRHTRCVVAAVILRPRKDKKCCSSHAGQFRWAPAGTHFSRVYVM